MRDDHQRDALRPHAVTLRNGRSATVRPICPEDKDELEAAFGRLCAEARYTRFFTAVHTLPEKTLDSATHPAPDREVALVALSDEGSRQIIIGGARYVSAPGSDSCEFAVTVADDWRGLAARLGFADAQCPEDRTLRVVTLEL
jgi:hypothetical protein